MTEEDLTWAKAPPRPVPMAVQSVIPFSKKERLLARRQMILAAWDQWPDVHMTARRVSEVSGIWYDIAYRDLMALMRQGKVKRTNISREWWWVRIPQTTT